MIDLRSDILSPLRPEVGAAFVEAAVRAPAYGIGEDLDERALEEEVADLFGFEAALLVPTGTMANQIAVRLACSPGECLLADASSHIATNEMQSTVGLSAVCPVTRQGAGGHLSAMQIDEALAPPPPNKAARQVRLVCLENTHNRAGGTVMPPHCLAEIVQILSGRRAALHLDGARLWNAAVALDLSDPELPHLTAGADTASINLNKALGAPLGSLFLGTQAAVREAAALRRVMGGWWRPLGPIAAAARAALSDFRERLAQDHAHAAFFAKKLAEGGVRVTAPETNIVMVRFGDPEAALRHLASVGVAATEYGSGRLRFVFHGGVGAEETRTAADSVLTIPGEYIYG